MTAKAACTGDWIEVNLIGGGSTSRGKASAERNPR